MKKSLLLSIALSASVFVFALVDPPRAIAQPHGGSRGHGSSSDSKETYLVVKIVGESKGENRLASRGENNTDSKVEYKVINSSQYKDEERRLKDAYKQKLKEWKDLKKIEPTAPMPVKPTIKKIGDTFQTQKIAQEYAQKLNDEEADKDNPAPGTARN